jgi:hypothetical protein
MYLRANNLGLIILEPDKFCHSVAKVNTFFQGVTAVFFFFLELKF